MSSQTKTINSLTVHPPISSKQLGRYRAVTGVFLVRQADTVVYIGVSTNIYKGVIRLFQKGGVLSHFDRHRVTFEIVISPFRAQIAEIVLKRLFKAEYNLRALLKKLATIYQEKQSKRVLKSYLEQTRFEVPNLLEEEGEHQTDKKD